MSLELTSPRGEGCYVSGAMLELPVVLVLVVGASRLDDEAVVSEGPLLEAGDSHGLSGTAGSRVRARERPVVLDRLVVEDDFVHEYLDVRERVDERTRDLGDLGGASPLIAIVPPGTKCSATFVGSWLHQASV